MSTDMCVPCADGVVNIRVGALIAKDGKILMVESCRGYLYSVGGRIKMGETAREAVVREVLEETGVVMPIKRLIAVHENYFYGDMKTNLGKLIYEVSFYFLMDVPKDFEPVCSSVTEEGVSESLKWVSPDTPQRMFPDFFREEAIRPSACVRYAINDERKKRQG